MTDASVKRLALVLSIQAEIEGMKSNNDLSKHFDGTPQYNSHDFEHKAEELRQIAAKPDELL